MARITWQSVTGGAESAAAAVSALDTSRQSLDKGFGDLKGIVTGLKDDRIAENSAKYRDFLSQFNSAEELRAAEDAGIVANFKQSLGSLVNPDVMRDEAHNWQQTLNTRNNAAFEQSQKAALQDSAPILEEALRQYLTGNPEGARAVMEANPDAPWGIFLQDTREDREGAESHNLKQQADQLDIDKTEIESSTWQKQADLTNQTNSTLIDEANDKEVTKKLTKSVLNMLHDAGMYLNDVGESPETIEEQSRRINQSIAAFASTYNVPPSVVQEIVDANQSALKAGGKQGKLGALEKLEKERRENARKVDEATNPVILMHKGESTDEDIDKFIKDWFVDLPQGEGRDAQEWQLRKAINTLYSEAGAERQVGDTLFTITPSDILLAAKKGGIDSRGWLNGMEIDRDEFFKTLDNTVLNTPKRREQEETGRAYQAGFWGQHSQETSPEGRIRAMGNNTQ